MARVKRGVTSKRRHKKFLELAKGYRMGRRKLISVAKDSVLHAGEYAFHGRKLKKRDMRSLWITRLNAALRGLGVKYNAFIHMLKEKKLPLDRKVLAQMANEYPKAFESMVGSLKKEK